MVRPRSSESDPKSLWFCLQWSCCWTFQKNMWFPLQSWIKDACMMKDIRGSWDMTNIWGGYHSTRSWFDWQTHPFDDAVNNTVGIFEIQLGCHKTDEGSTTSLKHRRHSRRQRYEQLQVHDMAIPRLKRDAPVPSHSPFKGVTTIEKSFLSRCDSCWRDGWLFQLQF